VLGGLNTTSPGPKRSDGAGSMGQTRGKIYGNIHYPLFDQMFYFEPRSRGIAGHHRYL
jgi:hypothetical protein